MAISLKAPTNLLSIPGVRLSTAAAGIKYKDRDDLVLLELCEGTNTAVLLTKNQFCAAPVELCRKHLAASTPKYLLVNSGNANAGMGKKGIVDAKQTCTDLSVIAGCDESEVLPFSTGVIGESLPVYKISRSLPGLFASLEEDAWLEAAKSIMTTDTVAKGFSKQVIVEGDAITITGMAKGSGMIRPDMATMLAYVATDLDIDDQSLNTMLQQAVDQSFHCITVDGDTSTNDACALMATGRSKIKFKDLSIQNKDEFVTALNSIFLKLAQAVVRDGEGVTKFVTIKVEGAKTLSMAREIAFCIAHSPLVKTASFASDPNWGRILAAAGRATHETMHINELSLYINELMVIDQGEVAATYSEEKGVQAMSGDEIEYRINLGLSDAEFTVWTTDLSYDYVKINAEYRT